MYELDNYLYLAVLLLQQLTFRVFLQRVPQTTLNCQFGFSTSEILRAYFFPRQLPSFPALNLSWIHEKLTVVILELFLRNEFLLLVGLIKHILITQDNNQHPIKDTVIL